MKYAILAILGLLIMWTATLAQTPQAPSDPVAEQVAQQIGQLMIANAQCANQLKLNAQQSSEKISELQKKLEEALKLCGDKCVKVGETPGETDNKLKKP